MRNNGKTLIREILRNETLKVFSLVLEVFDQFVKKTMTQEGIEEFVRSAENYILKLPKDHFILVAENTGTISGMIDIRDNHHICLFFVKAEERERGIGKKLLNKAVKECLKRDPYIKRIEVNSAVNAVEAYKKMGFKTKGDEEMINGIRFVPMEKELIHKDSYPDIDMKKW